MTFGSIIIFDAMFTTPPSYLKKKKNTIAFEIHLLIDGIIEKLASMSHNGENKQRNYAIMNLLLILSHDSLLNMAMLKEYGLEYISLMAFSIRC